MRGGVKCCYELLSLTMYGSAVRTTAIRKQHTHTEASQASQEVTAHKSSMDVDEWLKEHASKRGKANMVKFIMERENASSHPQGVAQSTAMVRGAVVDQANTAFARFAV